MAAALYVGEIKEEKKMKSVCCMVLLRKVYKIWHVAAR
jgi:hypothetical protein